MSRSQRIDELGVRRGSCDVDRIEDRDVTKASHASKSRANRNGDSIHESHSDVDERERMGVQVESGNHRSRVDAFRTCGVMVTELRAGLTAVTDDRCAPCSRRARVWPIVRAGGTS
jgi:hypothetical protein